MISGDSGFLIPGDSAYSGFVISGKLIAYPGFGNPDKLIIPGFDNPDLLIFLGFTNLVRAYQ